MSCLGVSQGNNEAPRSAPRAEGVSERNPPSLPRVAEGKRE